MRLLLLYRKLFNISNPCLLRPTFIAPSLATYLSISVLVIALSGILFIIPSATFSILLTILSLPNLVHLVANPTSLAIARAAEGNSVTLLNSTDIATCLPNDLSNSVPGVS